jgi:hypothetical protein
MLSNLWRAGLVLVVALVCAAPAPAEVVELGRGMSLGRGLAVDGSRVLVASRSGRSVAVFGDPAWQRADPLLGRAEARDVQLAAGGGWVAGGRYQYPGDRLASVLVAGPAGGPMRTLERCRGRQAFAPPEDEFAPPVPAVHGPTVAWLACGTGDRVLLVDRGARRVLRPGGRVRALALAGRTLAVGVAARFGRASVVLIDLDGAVPERRVALPGEPGDVGLALRADGTVAVAAGPRGFGMFCPPTRVFVIPAGARTARALGLRGCGPQIALDGDHIVTLRAQRRADDIPDLVVAPLDGGPPTAIDRGWEYWGELSFTAQGGTWAATAGCGCGSRASVAARRASCRRCCRPGSWRSG